MDYLFIYLNNNNLSGFRIDKNINKNKDLSGTIIAYIKEISYLYSEKINL